MKIIAKSIISSGIINSLVLLGALGFSSSAKAIGLQITSIEITNVAGTSSPIGATSTDPANNLQTGQPYTLNYAGNSKQITGNITTSGATYRTSSPIPLTVVLRRAGITPEAQIIFAQGSTGLNTISPGPISLDSESTVGVTQEASLGTNNINLGTDNLFTNAGNIINNNNVERADFINVAGFSANDSLAFPIFERGGSGANDPFKIAVITSLDVSNNPLTYGTLASVVSGDYANVQTGGSNITFNSLTTLNDDPSSVNPNQNLGGVLLRPTLDLGIASGVTIYGFSLFANDTTGSGAQLVDFTNATFFPTNTVDGDGGLDLLSANVGVVSVPFDFNPQFGLAALGAAWFLRRQLKKAKNNKS